MADYQITTHADGYGRWHAIATFPHGAGNTGEGERLVENARRAARRAIVSQIAEREQTRSESLQDARSRVSASIGPLFVHANRSFAHSGALSMIEWTEAGGAFPRPDLADTCESPGGRLLIR